MEKKTSNLIYGVLCSIGCNLLFIVSNRLIKEYDLSGNNINFFKGLIQSVTFGSIIVIYHVMTVLNDLSTRDHNAEHEGFVFNDDGDMINTIIPPIRRLMAKKCDTGWLILFGLCYGLVFFAFGIGSTKIPFSYFVVIIATTPIFAVLFSRCILRTAFTVLKLLICVTLILGICMVTYKGFTKQELHSLKYRNMDFGDSGRNLTKNILIRNVSRSMHINSMLARMGIKETKKKPDSISFNRSFSICQRHPCVRALSYNDNRNVLAHKQSQSLNNELPAKNPNLWMGIICAFVFAILGALANVIPVKCKDTPVSYMMISAGMGSLFVSSIAHVVPKFQIDIPFGYKFLSTPKMSIEIGIGFMITLTNGLLIFANRLSSPTINSVIRRSEILLVLGHDILFLQDYPDSLQICGYVTVTLSVIAITFSDPIQELLTRKTNESPHQEV